MRPWFSRRPSQPADDAEMRRIAKAVAEILGRYRALIDRHPLAILDTAALPLPKSDMKMVLKMAWRLASSEAERDVAERGYLQLSRFHEGVGERPIDPALSARDGPKAVADTAQSLMPWETKAMSEFRSLNEDFRRFKRRRAQASAAER